MWPTTKVDEGAFRVEFPDIFRTLILNREIMPGGRGKRLRVRGDFTGIVANIQANQASGRREGGRVSYIGDRAIEAKVMMQYGID